MNIAIVSINFKTKVKFLYHLKKDTPEYVASELVNHLNIPEKYQKYIKEYITSQVKQYSLKGYITSHKGVVLDTLPLSKSETDLSQKEFSNINEDVIFGMKKPKRLSIMKGKNFPLFDMETFGQDELFVTKTHVDNNNMQRVKNQSVYHSNSENNITNDQKDSFDHMMNKNFIRVCRTKWPK